MTSQQTNAPRVVFSIVSHGQLHLIRNLLDDLRPRLEHNHSIVLVINIPEDESCLLDFSDLPMSIIRNTKPRGFGENHNKAFDNSTSTYFVIVNPDIRLARFSLARLLAAFDTSDVGAAAPVVLSPGGQVEDSARKFPTVRRLLVRWIFGRREPDYQFAGDPIDVDWSAGMFVAFRSAAFRQVGGFDTHYYMYMEDADICRRLAKAGWRTVIQPATSVLHDAQRASHRSFRHLRWHLASAIRFLFLPTR